MHNKTTHRDKELREAIQWSHRLSMYLKLQDWSVETLQTIHERLDQAQSVRWLLFQLKIVGWYQDWLGNQINSKETA
ncbi:MAG: hypothetical protein HOD58_01340 [Gammaproteobacteria bacterium]|jgi:hypothetical protein|nr:hypothetical protein [Gammaproteobacteria bacterium]MBT4328551.1 hypothetical protein [Gammaproteobacteria bacterium]